MMEASSRTGAAMVVGGGIGGVQASLDLAESGVKVYLVDTAATIGGVMAMLDKTFPTNDCSMCIMAPKLVECGRHLNIDILTCAQIEKVEGEAGSFEVTLKTRPRFIDPEKCTGCGTCARQCPVGAVDDYNKGLVERRAVYIDYPQAVPLVYAIDEAKCIGCGLCQNTCLAKAVNFEDKPLEMKINVGAIILAPGFTEYDAGQLGEYGYGRFRNVVTSTEFERMMNASGPYGGHIVRPSDGEIPVKVAFIQCVGSRDSRCSGDGTENGYCSSVCCMYATKEAIVSKEHEHLVEPTIFFMDMRAHGRGFDRYYDRAQKEHGIRYIRARVSHVEEMPESGNLKVKYETDEGELVTEEFHLVVLSVGLSRPRDSAHISQVLGIELNHYGFAKTGDFDPVQTTRSGVYVCGAFSGPKDIPETVAQASAASGAAVSMLSDARWTLTREKKYPEEKACAGESPRIGVFVCHCGINIGGVVDVPSVVEYSKSLPNVAFTEENLYTCSADTQELIKQRIEEHNLNRVVVASCTPRTHEPLFQDTIREAGLNKYMFEMANIRDQDSWVHMNEPGPATEKAKDLVRMAVAKVSLLHPLEAVRQAVTPAALVIGGGVSGMSAALDLADSGADVFLVESDSELGGNAREIYYSPEGNDVQAFLEKLVWKVQTHPGIKVFQGAAIEEVSGYVGNFKTRVCDSQGNTEELVHGVVIVATGAEEYKPTEYMYGQDDRVITQRHLEDTVENRGEKLEGIKTVAMIQCVGSRTEENPLCSRICCSHAVKNALKLKERNPETEVYILYRDMRTYGFAEDYYRKAREQGVIFIRYEEDDPPGLLNLEGRLVVDMHDPIVNERLRLPVDLLVLSAGVRPREGNSLIAQMLKVPLDVSGFFLEAHVKLRPVDFASDGIFLCGLAHAPKSVGESISQARGAAARANVVLSKDEIEGGGIVSRVIEERCRGCEWCKEVCEFGAIDMVETEEGFKVARVNQVMCKGCGTCSAACPSGAIQAQHFTSEQIDAMIEAMVE
jgi:heterodisulfide reductase subunit A